jgi:hypothetical protein
MSVAENRLAHLKALVEREAQAAGGTERQQRSAGYRVVADMAGLTYDYVYQLVNNKSRKTKIGDEAAAKIDRAFRGARQPGWFDMPPEATASHLTGEDEFEPIRPPTVAEAVEAIAELLLHLDDDGRAMASTALSNLARNPNGAVAASKTLELLIGLHPREPDPSPSHVPSSHAAAARTRGKPKLTVKAGGGQKMQLDLPLKTVANPFDKAAAPAREREWYERVKSAPKAVAAITRDPKRKGK